MSKNSSITNFFKPVPRVSASPRQSQSQSQSETPTQTQSTASTASSQPPSSPTPPPLLPHTSFSPSPAPPPPPSTVRDRNQEIRGSDDEDDNFSDSDDDLFPDLFAPAPAASTLPAQPPVTRKDPNLMGTPRAKRPAVEFHSSPLTINTRHKFDINALLKHAKVDDAIEVSQQRTAALLQGSPSTTRTAAPGAAQDPLAAETSLHDAMLNMLPDPGDSQDEATRSRLLRAVKRTEAGVGKKEWFFFDKQPEQQQQQTKGTENQHVPAAFPKSKATGVWFILADKHRSEAFEDGLAYNVQCRLQNLPDEIFEWVLREAPWEKSRQLRDEYVRLLGACSDQIERQLTQDTVMDLFRDLGASDRALGGPTPSSSSSGAEPEQQGALYPEQSRHRLETVLRILEATAHAANGEVLTQTVSILLRLGIDNLVREDQIIATAYQDALFRLISSVSPRAWNSFVSLLLHRFPYPRSQLTFPPPSVWRRHNLSLHPHLKRHPPLERRLLHPPPLGTLIRTPPAHGPRLRLRRPPPRVLPRGRNLQHPLRDRPPRACRRIPRRPLRHRLR
jgi:hypothetical protein